MSYVSPGLTTTDAISVLSGQALGALQDFYAERKKELDAFEQLRSTTSHETKPATYSISAFKEDWNASQFWVKALRIFAISRTNAQ